MKNKKTRRGNIRLTRGAVGFIELSLFLIATLTFFQADGHGQDIPGRSHFAPTAQSIQADQTSNRADHLGNLKQSDKLGPEIFNAKQRQSSRHITYRLNAEEGTLSGRFVMPAVSDNLQPTMVTAPIQVSLYYQQKLIKQTVTNDQGQFQFRDLPTGAYAMVAINQQAIATFGVWVDNQAASSENVLPLISVARSIAGLEPVAKRFLPNEVWWGNEDTVGQQAAVGVPREITSGQFGVRLVEGMLNGQVVDCDDEGTTLPGTNAVVNLIQHQVRIADVEVDSEGRFEIPDVEPGFYDLVVVGINGIAVFRFEALGADEPLFRNASFGTGFGTGLETGKEARLRLRRSSHIIPNVLKVILTPNLSGNENSRYELEAELSELSTSQDAPASTLDPAGQAFSAGGAEGSFYNQNGQFNYAGFGRGSRAGNLGMGRGRLFAPGIIAGSIIAISVRDNPPPVSASR